MNNLTFFAPIEKTDDEERMVYGYASTEAVDSQGEVVKKDALGEAINDYMKFANIREMHQPSAVGKAQTAKLDDKGLYIAVKVVDDNAWKKVKEGVYNGFSIGGKIKTMVGNAITGLHLSEISLVDRPANPEAVFDVWKGDGVIMEEKKLAKGMFDVAQLAGVIEQLHNIEEWVECEGSMENDPMDDEYAKKLVEQIKSLGELLSERVKREVEEIVEEEKTESVMEMSEKVEDLEKSDVVEKKEDEKIEKSAECRMSNETKDECVSRKIPEIMKDDPSMKQEQAVAIAESMCSKPCKEEKVEMSEIEKAINELKMPTDEQINELLKSQGIEANNQSIGVFKMKCADAIIAKVSESMKIVAENDLKNKEEVKNVEKVDNSEIISKIDSLIGHYSTKSEVVKEEIVEKVDDISKTESLTKENSDLKAKIEKMENQLLPIKAKASFAVIEKFDTKSSDLEKAEAELDELADSMKKDPSNYPLQKRAAAKAQEVMNLRRQVR